ncbi:MAG: single-stranded-DNA-specific exonuclease RecJ [Thermodesulfovibrionales bacterium]|nr:single-stranded-DNA-specific exonuclease RecJ [Thermodesulfovibrionales bacterium]
MHRKWLVNRTNREFISYLSSASSISPTLAQVLINRGIKTPEDVRDFLRPGLPALSNPFEMPGTEAACEAINAAKKAGKKVFVHGDYDVDGLTATAIMVSALRALGLDAGYFIPNRFAHGYGFGPHAVGLAGDSGSGLIITVDCGISSFEACEAARAAGIGVIITDHHEPVRDGNGCVLPGALSIVNPKLGPAPAGASALSGAGVALKMALALGLSAEDFLDLAALGTIADVVPLTGENRIIVKQGLGFIQEGRRHGIRALKTVSGLDGKEIKAGHLSFTVLPRMNAAGRMSDAGEVVELLLSSSEEAALGMASALDKKNSERQKVEEKVYKEAMGLLSKKGISQASSPHAIVLSGEGWHEGVIGIVAARIAEQFGRPAFIFSIKGEVAKGSARSIPGLDIHAGLLSLKGLLISFGGHRQAAGLKARVSELEAFEEGIIGLVEAGVSDFTPSLTVDADIGLEDVSFGLAGELASLEPFGMGNPEPLFGSSGLEMVGPRVVGNNHLKTKLKGKRASVEAIGFDMGGLIEKIGGTKVDAVFTVNINEWEGGRTLQLNLKALRPHSSQETS